MRHHQLVGVGGKEKRFGLYVVLGTLQEIHTSQSYCIILSVLLSQN
jgi:hypothetical protein